MQLRQWKGDEKKEGDVAANMRASPAGQENETRKGLCGAAEGVKLSS